MGGIYTISRQLSDDAIPQAIPANLGQQGRRQAEARSCSERVGGIATPLACSSDVEAVQCVVRAWQWVQ